MARRNPLLGNRSGGTRYPGTDHGTTGHPASTKTPAPDADSLRGANTGARGFTQKSRGRAGRKALGGNKKAGSANRSGAAALLRVMGHMVGNAPAGNTAGRVPAGRYPAGNQPTRGIPSKASNNVNVGRRA